MGQNQPRQPLQLPGMNIATPGGGVGNASVNFAGEANLGLGAAFTNLSNRMSGSLYTQGVADAKLEMDTQTARGMMRGAGFGEPEEGMLNTDPMSPETGAAVKKSVGLWGKASQTGVIPHTANPHFKYGEGLSEATTLSQVVDAEVTQFMSNNPTATPQEAFDASLTPARRDAINKMDARASAKVLLPALQELQKKSIGLYQANNAKNHETYKNDLVASTTSNLTKLDPKTAAQTLNLASQRLSQLGVYGNPVDSTKALMQSYLGNLALANNPTTGMAAVNALVQATGSNGSPLVNTPELQEMVQKSQAGFMQQLYAVKKAQGDAVIANELTATANANSQLAALYKANPQGLTNDQLSKVVSSNPGLKVSETVGFFNALSKGSITQPNSIKAQGTYLAALDAATRGLPTAEEMILGGVGTGEIPASEAQRLLNIKEAVSAPVKAQLNNPSVNAARMALQNTVKAVAIDQVTKKVDPRLESLVAQQFNDAISANPSQYFTKTMVAGKEEYTLIPKALSELQARMSKRVTIIGGHIQSRRLPPAAISYTNTQVQTALRDSHSKDGTRLLQRMGNLSPTQFSAEWTKFATGKPGILKNYYQNMQSLRIYSGQKQSNTPITRKEALALYNRIKAN